jgi:hypothetical protein
MSKFTPDALVSSFIADDVGTQSILHSTEQYEAPVIPQVSAVEEWNQAIAAAMTRGANKSAATRAVMIADPDLHQRFLAEFNDNARPSARKSAAPSPVIQEWDSAISAAMKGGTNKAQAIRAVVAANPDLHSRYLAAVNERPSR